jgi:hypothetical protein
MIARLLGPCRLQPLSSSLASHLTRDAIAFCALALVIVPPWQAAWPALVLVPLAILMLCGCPMCWLTGTACALQATRSPLLRSEG